MTTITLNKKTKAGKILYDFAQNLAIKNKGIVIDDNQSEKKLSLSNDAILLNKIKRSAKHAVEIGAGIRKGNSIKILMDEL